MDGSNAPGFTPGDRYLHARVKGQTTTGIKPDGMHRMPLGLPQGIVTFMLGRRSNTTGIKPVAWIKCVFF